MNSTQTNLDVVKRSDIVRMSENAVHYTDSIFSALSNAPIHDRRATIAVDGISYVIRRIGPVHVELMGIADFDKPYRLEGTGKRPYFEYEIKLVTDCDRTVRDVLTAMNQGAIQMEEERMERERKQEEWLRFYADSGLSFIDFALDRDDAEELEARYDA